MGLKRAHEDHENHERWLVSYADFITLLFAFFTVLYATSQQDAEKAKKFEESIRKYMGSIFSGTGPGSGPGGNVASQAPIETPIQNLADHRNTAAAVEAFIAEYLEKNMTEEDRKKVVADIVPDKNGVRVRLASAALFSPGSATINGKALPALQAMSHLIKESGHQVVVEGYTDHEAAQTKDFPSEWELSAVRATKVVRLLVERMGVPAKQISAQGYGSQKPLAPGSTAEQNRRIEIYLLNKEVE